MNKIDFYRKALANLGVASTIRFEIQKRFYFSHPMRLTSKVLDFPVVARRTTSDLLVFHQIFTLNEYRCLDNVNVDDGLIVDLGANVGYSSAYFLSRFPKCSVIAVEPDPENFATLKLNLSSYRDRLIAIQAAIWPGTDRVSLQKRGRGQEWSTRTVPSSGGAIQTITIPEIMRVTGRDRIALLKIDIEGAEKQLFDSDTCWLEAVDNIVIELHGENCERSFFAKIDRSRFSISECDELTVCLGVRSTMEALAPLHRDQVF